jgi:hypothetical protein
VLSQNYGASDYDIRHSFMADFVWDTPFKFSNKILGNILGGWTLSGKFFFRTGTPFTIYDGNLPGLLAGANINASPNFARRHACDCSVHSAVNLRKERGEHSVLYAC